jgi:hypothetical protein
MKNRAKCKLCSNIIESFHTTDFVMCKCEEISVSGGDALKCGAKNWDNFLRVDDDGHEIVVKIESPANPQNTSSDDSAKSNSNNSDQYSHKKPSKIELLDILKEMIKNIENLPEYAMSTPITHYDFSSFLILFLALFDSDDCRSDS